MVGLVREMVGGRMIQQKIYSGDNYFIRLSDYPLLFRLANIIFAYGYNIYRCMILETEIDGLLYSLDTDEQEAMVKKCMDRERQGEVIIPASFFHQGIVYRVTSIGKSAFRGCTSLTAITIPEGVTSVGSNAFSGCSNLTAIVVAEENKVYDSRGGCNAIIETNTNTLIQGCSATIIPESVTSIGGSAFEGCIGLTAITIPESVTSIGECAFANCSSLTDITLPDGVTSIEGWTFYNCSSLTTINIPKSVTTIGYCAFSGCTSLTGILIPKGVTSIGKEALKNFGITYLTILGKPAIDEKAFDGCGQLTDIYCYSEEVPPAKDNTYSGLDLSRITLHVPERALKAYKNTEPWSRFGMIVAIK